MVLVVVGGVTTACLLIFAGVHLLASGSLRGSFEPPTTLVLSQSRLGPWQKFAGALLFIIPGIATFWILVFALLGGDNMHRTLAWAANHGLGLFGGLFLLAYGLVSIFRPDIVLRGVQKAYPDQELGGRSVHLMVRIVGLLLSALALIALASLQNS